MDLRSLRQENMFVIVKVALLETGLDQLEAVSVVCGMRDRDHGRATDWTVTEVVIVGKW